MTRLNLFAIGGLVLTISCLAVMLVNVVFGRKKVNFIWSLFNLSVAIWGFGAFMVVASSGTQKILFWWKVNHIGVIWMPVFILHTVYLLTSKVNKKILIFAYVQAVFFQIIELLPTLLFFKDLRLVFSSFHYVTLGALYHPFFLLWVYLVVYAHVCVYKEYVDSSGLKKLSLLYFLVGSILGFSGGFTNFLIGYKVDILPYGNFTIPIYCIMVTYAIIRHHLMDIEIVIKKTLVFAGLLGSVFAILVLPTLLIQEYIFRSASASGKLVGLALSGLIIILSLRRIENFLTNITDKHLFQKKYDYKELLRTFTSEVLTVINLYKLVNLTVDKLTDIVKINSSAVLLLNEEKRQFDVVASHNVKDAGVSLLRPDGIVTFLEQTHGYLLKKDLIEKNVYIPPSIQEIIDKLSAELIIPMVLHTEVKGILSLGKKKSDEEYTQDDLDILLPLARTLAIAISNAKLFEELSKTQAEAAQKEKMAVIGTLSAGINHEICNPLGISRGQCEAFLLNVKDGLYDSKSDKELLDKAKDIMAKVIKETDRATAITKKLSGFAKPAKGEAELVNIDKEIDDVLGLVGYELKLEKIEFEKQIPKDLPDIFVDKKQFQEVLFNLIRNAGQAIGEKGKIVVRVRQDRDKVFVDIKDTGTGIPEDKLKELFNPFFTTKEPGKGTGLGLFIVRQVVEKNGGKIYLNNTKVGEGTTFTVEFPTKASQESKI
jgi:signal transduction histidine kinase